VVSNESRWEQLRPSAVTVDGNRVVYRLAGEGPLLLLVHGMAGSSQTWKYVFSALAERFTVLAPDLLGQGESDKPDGSYSLEYHANTLRALMDALGFPRATFVGQSLGGGVALQLAWESPERCERLVLVNSGGLGRELTIFLRMLSLPGWETIFPFVCSPRIRDAGERVAGWLEHAGFESTPAAREIWGSYASLAFAANRRAFFRSLREVIDFGGQAVSAFDRLHVVAETPTLIVWGAEDPFLPASHAVAAHEALPGSRLEIFEGVGHYPHCEAPERFVTLLRDFAETSSPARLSEPHLPAT
jgi:pimeloyl-ACP methyl ester carboxylesterase